MSTSKRGDSHLMRRASPRKRAATDFFFADPTQSSASSSSSSSSAVTNNNKAVVSIKKKKTVSPVKPASVTSSSSSTSTTTTNNNATSTSISLLEDWISHKDAAFHHFQPDEATQIRQALLDWYTRHRRKLPWRGDPPPYEGSTAGIATTSSSSKNKKAKLVKSTTATTATKDYNVNAKQIPQSAYGIWVSEIMLQQTRVEAVIPYWCKWMESFPTPAALANATEEQVNAHWAGLGFYRRARLLHSAAQHIVKEYDGTLPETPTELQSIPGIGPYTASAIASIAFGVCVPVVDGNVCRVLSRLRGVANHIKAPIFKDKLAWGLAAQIVTAGDGQYAGEVNQAMMELGATYCAPSGTGVDEKDPLKEYYMSTKLGVAYYKEYTLQTSASKSRTRFQSLMEKAADANNESSCALCDKQGISNVLEQLAESIEDQLAKHGDNADNILDAPQRCGHSVFPTAPPKLSKREEVLAVAVISTTFTTKAKATKDIDDNTYWLLVKRPKKGLLAGQWEFPSTCVWTSSDTDTKAVVSTSTTPGSNSKGKGVKRKAPSSATAKANTAIEVPQIAASVRQKALVKLLDDILSNNDAVHGKLDSAKLKELKGNPLEHIFSHVRHTMWIDYASVAAAAAAVMEPTSWMSSTEREVRWMRESDMKKAGVTSGVKKILKAVKEEHQKSKKKQGFFQPKK